MFVPLSFGEDGASFEVPETLDGAGWLVLRKSAEGRGRPAVVHHRNGKPLVIPIGSTHDDLLSAAGKGRYRLQIVDQYGRKVDGVPVAHTGMLGVTAYPVGDADEYDGVAEDGEDGLQLGASPVAAPRRSSSNEAVLLHTVCSMFGQVVGQMVPMMSACTEIVETVSRVGLLGRAAVVEDAPPPVAPAPSPMGEASVLQTVMATLGPMVNQLCMALMMKGATPAAPVQVPAVPVPAAPVPVPVAPMPHRSAPMTTTSPMPSAPSSMRVPAASVPPTSAGAAPSDAHGAAPAEIPLEMQMRIGAQLRQVLAELTPEEQQLAAQLVTELPTEARTALLLELVHLSIPEAVARARSILASGSPSPSTGTPSTGTPRT